MSRLWTPRMIPAILSGMMVVGLTAAASRMPWQATDAGTAALRLSWRVPALTLGTCQSLVPGQGAQVPEHMRGAQLCEGEGLPWSLEVFVDDAPVVMDTIEAAGIRGDRPLYVLRTVAVDPGAHRLTVSFRPLPLAEGQHADSLARRSLALDTTIEVEERDVLLVTVDPGGGGLVTRRPIGPE